jgi:hypothetical protein
MNGKTVHSPDIFIYFDKGIIIFKLHGRGFAKRYAESFTNLSGELLGGGTGKNF